MPYTLENADSQEFARWWVVYRNANEDFSQNFSEQYAEIVDVPFCQWIMHNDQRVGGCIRVGSNIGDFFLIPPYHDTYTILKDILPADGDLVAQGITADYVSAFQMAGFQIMESRVWMLRPTQAYPDISFDYDRVLPQVDQSDAIAQLMFAAFTGGVGQYGQRDIEAHRQSASSYFEFIAINDICHQASSLLFEGDQLIAACLIQPYKSLTTVRFVVVHPDYQRKGIAQQLIQHSIHTIRNDYEYISLAVTIGNPAHGLYHQMGFVEGDAMHVLKRG